MKIQPKLQLAKYSLVELETYGQDKMTRIENNADFPSVQATILLLKALLIPFNTAISILNGNKADTATKNQLRVEVEQLLTLASVFCVIDAGGDTAKFLRSGFSVRSAGSPVGTLPEPQQFSFALSNKAGEAFASMEPFRQARGFSFAWALEPLTADSVWNTIPWPTRQYTFAGLPSGVKVWAKGGAVSPDGTTNYSSPISRTIQ